ncbi:MAG: hypothetical protein ACD_76C00069G0004 [uncultured bacterium]|nr:MAG: hypothetical protein ACD_76C00069G0004 [uncultured bacterium]HBD05122.1 hypothetical protein [Candidatus Uhrbacteria bacterium]
MKRIKHTWLWILVVILIFIFIVLSPAFVGTRPLTETEQKLAERIFEQSLDYNNIQINTGGPLTWIYPAVTTGNTISFPKGNYNQTDKKSQALLLHELTHVWQYQNYGWGYLPRAVFEEISQSDAYVIHFDESKSFRDYDIEEQAEIVAEYFLTNNEKYLPYIAELTAKRF